jgi:predicted NACHT family NTPase
VLLGEPGAGKTTTLWRLVYDLAQEALADPDAPLPLLAPLGGYTGPEPALAFVQGHFGDLGPHLPAYLQSRRVLLLLDALNEMPQQGRRERVDRIRLLLDKYDKTPAVVTCRALDYVSGDAEARGRGGQRYPWGKEPDPNRANYWLFPIWSQFL